MTCKRVLFWGVLLAVLTPPALGAQAEPDCAAWNTSEYFETATPEDVTACLAAGANVSARGTGQRTPLHQAALYNQNPAVIEALLAVERTLRRSSMMAIRRCILRPSPTRIQRYSRRARCRC